MRPDRPELGAPDRAGQMDTASLASSIFIIARKRPTGTGTGNHATDVLPALTTLIETRVRDLMAAGVTGADLVIATVGAGLAPFTRFDRVELPNGDELTAERYLDTVQREVLEVILAAVFALDRSGVRQIDVRSRFYVLARLQHQGPVEQKALDRLLVQWPRVVEGAFAPMDRGGDRGGAK
jgi:putative DNA methylase